MSGITNEQIVDMLGKMLYEQRRANTMRTLERSANRPLTQRDNLWADSMEAVKRRDWAVLDGIAAFVRGDISGASTKSLYADRTLEPGLVCSTYPSPQQLLDHLEQLLTQTADQR